MIDSDFRTALRTSAEEFLHDNCPIDRVHRHVGEDEPYARELWRGVADLGWMAIAVPEPSGGIGAGVSALGALHEALGAHLAPLPLLGTALLGEAAQRWHRADIAAQILPAIAAGELIGGVADLSSAASVSVDAHGVLNGRTILVDATAAHWLLLGVVRDGELGLALVKSDSSGVRRTLRATADRTRPLVQLTCHNVGVDSIAVMFGEPAQQLRKHLERTARLLLSADSIGGAGTILDVTVEYLKSRSQFGKPIGSFQALKHRAADLKLSLEMSRGLVTRALSQVDAEAGNGGAAGDSGAAGDDGTGDYWAAMAKAMACEAYLAIASESVQMHGAIGYTWEHQAHLFLKRATLNRALFGGTAVLQDKVAWNLVGRIS
jgi:alkylation response protein AidB-like acyl-CoA dehydrogenase